MVYNKKDFFGMKELSEDEIRYVLDTCETMKYIMNKKSKKIPYLQGKSVILLFFQPSPRAKLSYEMAAQNLCASVVDMTMNGKLNSDAMEDLGQLVDQMGGDIIVLRHTIAGAPQYLAKSVQAGIINAGDGRNENPGQSLLDLMTIKERKGGFDGLRVTILGDILHSRVARSNIYALTKLGAKVSIAAPPTLMPPGLSQLGVQTYYDSAEAVEGADVILCSRLKEEEMDYRVLPGLEEYRNFFIIDWKLLSHAQPDAIVMHPGPISRGVEISTDVLNSDQCIVNDRIANSVAVKMALMYILSQVRR